MPRPPRHRLPLTPFRVLDSVGRPIPVPAALPCCGLRGEIVTQCLDPCCQRCAERFWRGLIAWVRLRRQVEAPSEGDRPALPRSLRSHEAWIASKTVKMHDTRPICTEIPLQTPRSPSPAARGDLSGLVEFL